MLSVKQGSIKNHFFRLSLPQMLQHIHFNAKGLSLPKMELKTFDTELFFHLAAYWKMIMLFEPHDIYLVHLGYINIYIYIGGLYGLRATIIRNGHGNLNSITG